MSISYSSHEVRVSDRINRRHHPLVVESEPLQYRGRRGDGLDRDGMTVCQSTDDRSEAFSLVHRMYLRTGLTGDNVQGMRVIPHHLLDTTDVMVSRRDGVVDFTVTLVRDGELGLPAESLFPAEIDSMRSCGVKLAEVSCMASQCDRLTQRERLDMLVKMMSLTVRVARRRGVDRLLLAVHPRHAKAYQKMFGCIPCTEVKRYDAVEGNPAVLCLHDFARLDRERYLFYDRIYGTEHEPWKLDGPRMTSAEKEYFKKRVLKSADSFVPMAA